MSDGRTFMLLGDEERARSYDELVEGERRHRALLLHMSDIVLVLTGTGELSYASPSASRILGYPEGSKLQRDVLDLVHPDDRALTRRELAAIPSGSADAAAFELRLRSADGTYRRYEALANNLIEDPAVAGILVVIRDVTERHESEDAQRSQARVLELIACEAPVPTVLMALALSVEGQLEGTLCTVLLAEPSHHGPVFRVGASPGMPAGYGRALDGCDIPSHPSPCGLAVRSGAPVLVSDLMTDDRFPAMRELARACDVRSCWSFPVLSPTTGALLGTFALYGRSPGLPDPGTEAIVARASRLVAITLDRQVLLGRLAHQAQHDDLTGLPNRLTLLDRLTTALEQPAASSWPAVIFIDLDRLKVVNDSLGHDVGDELLVIVADRLTGVLPEAATVARFGGDEFVVLTTVPDAYEGAALAERVLTTVAAPVLLAGRTITPSASAGVVLARTGQSATEVLRDADIAMYRAKHDGGSGFALFNDDMRQRAFDRLDLEQQIREGIAAEEFRVYYQPVVDLTAGDALVGFEALVRWEHPTRGTLGPASFIQLAEETGAIVELGDWVLRRTAATVGAWGVREPRRTGTVAVNLAALQLGAPGLVAAVGDAVTTLGAWSLSLELTESSLMGNTIATRGIVDELVALGASLAIDDFGTGFSSLSYLTRLPVHTLKIDRSFVHDLDNPAAMAVAQTVVSLATGLRLDVVAEGIETAAQRSALVSMGCRFGQGFLFGRPLPEDEAFAVLRAAASS